MYSYGKIGNIVILYLRVFMAVLTFSFFIEDNKTYLAFSVLAEPWFVVMVKAPQGDVLSYLKSSQKSGGSTSQDELLIILKGIISGLEYLHSKSVSPTYSVLGKFK